MFDSTIFFSSIILCMSLGSYYKKIENAEVKRNYGAGLGILITCLICGHHIYHSVLMIWGNVIIIKCCEKSYIHQMSLGFTWIYLFYLHLNLQNIFVIWLHQTLALRLVGLAFEIRGDVSKDLKGASTSKFALADTENTVVELTPIDIITYAYCFIGLQKGPYYTWKVFNDYFKTPFGILGDYRITTKQKLQKALFCALAYNLLLLKYSTNENYLEYNFMVTLAFLPMAFSQMYTDKEFYTVYETDARYLYNIPLLLMYVLYTQSVTSLCARVCTETGFGVYPAKCQPLPGFGPTTRLSLLKLASTSPEEALEQEYNFSMLKCFDNSKLIFGPQMKDTMRSWDIPTRFWFWKYIYKNLLPSNKEVRSAFSFFIYTMWLGPSLSQVILSCTLWVHVHLEAEYCELYNPQISMKVPWQIGCSIMRVLCIIYLTPCLMVLDVATLLKYYNSIFWIYHIVLFFLIILSVCIYKSRIETPI